MTDFGKWDKFVAALSDSEDEGDAAAGGGAGAARAEDEAVAPRPKVANGMGNALDRHNARHTDAPKE